jgi:hypothetical protein
MRETPAGRLRKKAPRKFLTRIQPGNKKDAYPSFISGWWARVFEFGDVVKKRKSENKTVGQNNKEI